MIENFGDIKLQKEVKKLSKSALIQRYYDIVKAQHINGIEKAFLTMEMDKSHLDNEDFTFEEFMTLFMGHFEQLIAEEVLLRLYNADTHDVERELSDTASAASVDEIYEKL